MIFGKSEVSARVDALGILLSDICGEMRVQGQAIQTLLGEIAKLMALVAGAKEKNARRVAAGRAAWETRKRKEAMANGAIQTQP